MPVRALPDAGGSVEVGGINGPLSGRKIFEVSGDGWYRWPAAEPPDVRLPYPVDHVPVPALGDGIGNAVAALAVGQAEPDPAIELRQRPRGRQHGVPVSGISVGDQKAPSVPQRRQVALGSTLGCAGRNGACCGAIRRHVFRARRCVGRVGRNFASALGPRGYLYVSAVAASRRKRAQWAQFHGLFLRGKPDVAQNSREPAILPALVTMEDRPWSEWSRGKPLSPRGLATLLKSFGIAPSTIRLDGDATPKGYKRAAFEPVWKRYDIPSSEAPPKPSATTPQLKVSTGFDDSISATSPDRVADGKSLNSAVGNGCGVVAATNPPIQETVYQTMSRNVLRSWKTAAVCPARKSSLWSCQIRMTFRPISRRPAVRSIYDLSPADVAGGMPGRSPNNQSSYGRVPACFREAVLY